jgi:hypothetical protein
MKIFAGEVDLGVEVDEGLLQRPREGVGNASCHRSWVDLRRTRWREVDAALALERLLLEGAVRSGDLWHFFEEHRDDVFEVVGVDLDIGTISATLALNAARCATSMSCIGHGRHLAYVQFWARVPKVSLLAEAAKNARVGFCNHDGGGIEVYSNELEGLHRFAEEVRVRSAALRKARETMDQTRRMNEPAPSRQLFLL